MSWNYRVVRGEGGLRIFDVYYNEAGELYASHVTPTYVHGETVDDLKAQLALMLEALERPVLEERELDGSEDSEAKA